MFGCFLNVKNLSVNCTHTHTFLWKQVERDKPTQCEQSISMWNSDRETADVNFFDLSKINGLWVFFQQCFPMTFKIQMIQKSCSVPVQSQSIPGLLRRTWHQSCHPRGKGRRHNSSGGLSIRWLRQAAHQVTPWVKMCNCHKLSQGP